METVNQIVNVVLPYTYVISSAVLAFVIVFYLPKNIKSLFKK